MKSRLNKHASIHWVRRIPVTERNYLDFQNYGFAKELVRRLMRFTLLSLTSEDYSLLEGMSFTLGRYGRGGNYEAFRYLSFMILTRRKYDLSLTYYYHLSLWGGALVAEKIYLAILAVFEHKTRVYQKHKTESFTHLSALKRCKERVQYDRNYSTKYFHGKMIIHIITFSIYKMIQWRAILSWKNYLNVSTWHSKFSHDFHILSVRAVIDQHVDMATSTESLLQ